MNLILYDIVMFITSAAIVFLLILLVIALCCELIENKNKEDNNVYYIFEVKHMNLLVIYKDIVYASSMRDAEKKIRRRFRPSEYVIKSIDLVGEC